MPSLAQRRQEILDEIARLDRLQRGYLSKQFFSRSEGGEAVRYGPYFVLQHAFKGRKVSRRVPEHAVKAVEADLAAWRHFEQLAEEFVEVTERMTLEAEADVDSKKNARRSLKRVSAKRKTSSS